MTEKICIYGKPHAKQRPRVYGRVAFTPQATKDAERAIAICYGSRKRFTGALSIAIDFYMPTPRSASAKRTEAMEGQPCTARNGDLDNLIKTVLDGLNGIAFIDDAQTCEIKARKFWSSDPRTEVTIYGE